MKLLISLIAIALIASGIYFYLSKKINKKQKQKKPDWKILGITGVVVAALVGFVAFQMYIAATASDIQCAMLHTTTSIPPSSLHTAIDYFNQGNYDYEMGNCKKAIADYNKSIELNAQYPQAYNNRAYTYMRMRDYKDALPDLNKALALNPNYIHALMNRGDIHNYYFAIDRQSAVADYEKVIALGGTHGTSVCGHLFLAEHNVWNLLTIVDFPKEILRGCN